MSLTKVHTVFRIRCNQISEILYLSRYKGSISFDTCRGIASKINNEETSNEVSEYRHSTEVIKPNNARGYTHVSKDVNFASCNADKEFLEMMARGLNKYHLEEESNTLQHKYSNSAHNLSKHINNVVPKLSNKFSSEEATLDANENGVYDASENVNNNLPEVSIEPDSVNLIDKCDFDSNDALTDSDEKPPSPLDTCTEDLSHIGPYMTPTYNFAKIADDSITLQQLIKLGVKLYKLEKYRDVFEMLVNLDFDKDIKPYIRFLNDCRVLPDNLGNFITENPKIFKEDMEDLHTRIRYLIVHKFTPEMIAKIINCNPLWLSFKTQEIDRRLGHFQNTFKLTGSEVRHVATKCPKLITYNEKHIERNFFCIKEEMGFSLCEMKDILKTKPVTWMCSKSKILRAFNYVHNEMNISHELICKQPGVLSCRKRRLVERHQFLVKLNKNQYDPSKPLYISLIDIISGDDLTFCTNVAGVSTHTFNLFLKTI
ncbi:mitochondrial transcription termination factor 3 [Nomia melanderi]|uniref:mitochondrial transcription termination factor 3 n=1 Tax=Nomia melanderi TaxID=2448451 RepID=UPI0013047189|nr:transcription termination factor 3, mitochondrial [Nomia melanderi]